MSTTDLIDRLARDLKPVRAHAVERDVAAALAAGAIVALALVLARYGVQPDLFTWPRGAALAMKTGYALALGAIAAVLTLALARPGSRERHWRPLLVPFVMLMVLAIAQASAAPEAAWSSLALGKTWQACSWRIAGLALPIMMALMAAVRRQAPVHLRRAGAAIGLLSGSIAATLYALACAENAAVFVLIWYSLGIALSTALGALVGPRALRW